MSGRAAAMRAYMELIGEVEPPAGATRLFERLDDLCAALDETALSRG